MADDAGQRPTIFVDQDMAEPVEIALDGGAAVVYSSRCPDKDPPNEDAAAVLPAGDGAAVLAVADGCGGHPAGEDASSHALRRLHKCIAEARRQNEPYVRGAILDSFESANREIVDAGAGSATTLVVAEVSGAEVRTYHAGDSVILLTGQRGRLKLQTIAHAPVAYAVEAGVLGESEAMHHEHRSFVSNLVGAPDMRIEIGSAVRMGSRDTLVIASDGLSDNLETREIVEIVRKGSLGVAASELAAAARARMTSPEPGRPSHPDDLTFILYRRK